MIGKLFRFGKHHSRSVSETEARFLRLYSRWHETHDLVLMKKLLVRLRLVTARIPDFDLRSRFKEAF